VNTGLTAAVLGAALVLTACGGDDGGDDGGDGEPTGRQDVVHER
jgi:hypothetical protein